MDGLYEVAAPRRLPRSKNVIDINSRGTRLHANGALGSGDNPRKSALTSFIGTSHRDCGLTHSRDLVCIDTEPPPSLVDHSDDRVIMRNVRDAAWTESRLFVLDSEGRLYCQGHCGGTEGIDETDTLVIVPLRDPSP